MPIRKLVAAFSSLLMVGCASGGSSTSGAAPVVETARVTSGSQVGFESMADRGRHEAKLMSSIGTVWAALPNVLDSLGVPVTSSNPASHEMGNAGFEVRQKLGSTMVTRYFDCGAARGGSSAMSYDLFVTVTVRLEAASAATTAMTTKVDVKGKPITYSGSWIPCATTGELEQRIVDRLKARLGG